MRLWHKDLIPLLPRQHLGFSHVLTGIEAYNYPEHNQAYLVECLENLKAKGITL